MMFYSSFVMDYFLAVNSNFLESSLVAWQLLKATPFTVLKHKNLCTTHKLAL